jgi:sterol desaturase/sphingolipid hydroxylase (fatty acid hydroxylase superfamily)
VTNFLMGVAVKTGIAYVYLAAFICLLVAAEMAFPREPLMSFRDRIRVVIFAAIYIPFTYVTGPLIYRAVPNFEPLIPSIGVGNAIAAILIADFLYYWMHRAQHSIPWLWRIHAVHHSIEKMGAGSGFHHLIEAPLRALLVAAPTTIIFGGKAGAVAGFFVVMHGYYVHTTTRLGFGRFAWLVCDNRVHRIHHSREPRHFDKNFGVLTLVWDKLFGTAYMPQADEWPDVGLDEKREPRSIREWVSLSGVNPHRTSSDVAACKIGEPNSVDVR